METLEKLKTFMGKTKNRANADKVRKLYNELTGIEVPGCLCSAKERVALYEEVQKWIDENDEAEIR